MLDLATLESVPPQSDNLSFLLDFFVFFRLARF